MKFLLIPSCAVLLFSCMSNNTLSTTTLAQKNVDRMWNIELGMTQEQVFQIMRYPTRDNHIVTDEGCYDIWFYLTNPTVLDQGEYVEKNLTPLIFKNGIYIAKGYSYYHWLLKKSEEAANTPLTPKSTPKSSQDNKLENKDMEKALQAPPAPAGGSETQKPAPAQQQKTPPTGKPNYSPSASKPKQPPANQTSPSPKTPTPKPEQNSLPGKASSLPPTPPGENNPTPTPPQQTPVKPKKTSQLSKQPNLQETLDSILCMRSKQTKNPNTKQKSPPAKETKPDKQTQPEEKKPLKDSDQRMLDQEQEENFNYW